MDLPSIGVGTWELVGNHCTKIVKAALELGYRHIDTAHSYKNHEAIQKAIVEFDRRVLFITSKIALEDQLDPAYIEDSVERACDLALKELGTDYLDLYLIHWPNRSFPLTDIFEAMQKLVRKGKIRSAGISNFTIHHIKDLLDKGLKPAANQIEFHPYLHQKELLVFCQSHQIRVIAYRPLGKGALLKEPLFQKIGLAHNKTAAQVVLRWLIQKGLAVVPKAGSEQHLRENLDIFDFSLDTTEIELIDALHKNQRFCMPEETEFNY